MPLRLYTIWDEGIFLRGGWMSSPSQNCSTGSIQMHYTCTVLNNCVHELRRIHPCAEIKAWGNKNSLTHTWFCVTQPHLFLIGAFTASKCTGAVPAGAPFVCVRCTDPLKETGTKWNDGSVTWCESSVIMPQVELIQWPASVLEGLRWKNKKGRHSYWSCESECYIVRSLISKEFSKLFSCGVIYCGRFSYVGWHLKHPHFVLCKMLSAKLGADQKRLQHNTWPGTITWTPVTLN